MKSRSTRLEDILMGQEHQAAGITAGCSYFLARYLDFPWNETTPGAKARLRKAV